MDLLNMLGSIDKPHTEDTLARLSTEWGASLNPAHVLEEYPRPQFMRSSYIPLNGYWEYCITKTPDIPISRDGKILVPFSPETTLSGVERQLMPDEFLWYFKTLPTLSRPFKNARLLLHFGAVDQTAEIYCNDRYLCTHVGGYLPFTVDITDTVFADNKAVQTASNITVRVQDVSQTSWHSRGKQTLLRGGMYYTAQSGIWGSVWLEWVPANYLRAVSIIPHDDLCTVTLQMETLSPCRIEALLCDADCHVLSKTYCATSSAPTEDYPPALCKSGSDLKPCNLVGNGTYTAHMRIHIRDAHLWSPEDPYLYRMRLIAGEDIVDTYFAMRSFGTGTDKDGHVRFMLNHKPLFLNGVLDQGYWPESLMTAPSDKALIFDIEQMKKLGFNMMRKHIKIESARWYYHCDRLGMLVWQDMVSGGSDYSKPLLTYLPTLFPNLLSHIKDTARHYHILSRSDAEGRTQWTNEMKGTINYLKSVPSICTWVLFNEGWGQFDADEMTTLARSLDPTRPIDQASGWFDQHGGDYLSCHNYFRKIKGRRDKHGRAYVVSEYGGYSLRVDGHSSVERVYGYHKYTDAEKLNADYLKLMNDSIGASMRDGLAGAVYTQVSDVEEEVNGIFSYDRKVQKIMSPWSPPTAQTASSSESISSPEQA